MPICQRPWIDVNIVVTTMKVNVSKNCSNNNTCPTRRHRSSFPNIIWARTSGIPQKSTGNATTRLASRRAYVHL